jgi:hypothetical protein
MYRTNIYIGSFTRTGSGDVIFTTKFNPSTRQWLWVNQSSWSWNTNYFQGLAVDSQGDAFVTGSFKERIDFGAHSVTNPLDPGTANDDLYIAKIDGDTNEWLWVEKVVDQGVEISTWGYDIAIGPSDEVYVSGRITNNFNSGIPLDLNFGDDFVVTNCGGPYWSGWGFVAKLDNSTGQWEWAAQMCSDESYFIHPRALKINSEGDLFVGGAISGLHNFGQITLENYGNEDAFVAKLDGDSNHWLGVINAGSPSNTEGYDIAVGPSDEIYVVGNFYINEGSNPGGSAKFNDTNIFAAWPYDMFIWKARVDGG